MLTAAGYNAPATCAAIRARISGARTDNIWDPYSGQYLDVCRPHTQQWWEGPDMLAELATPPVLECLAGLPPQVPREAVPLLVLLSAPDQPARPHGLADIVVRELRRRLPFEPDRRIQALEQGRTGIIEALSRSRDLLTSGQVTHTVVVGVDTLLRQRVVDAYNDRRRVLTPKNSNGFIPGEAACSILIAAEGQQPGDEFVVIGEGQGH
jgi:3-oxoacyl-[acyl-carrier-protein] synthase-1